MLLSGYRWMREMLIIKDCIEYQGISANGLASINRVVAEQQHLSLPQVSVHYYSMLGNRRTLVEQASSKRVLASEKRKMTSGRF